MGLGNHVSEDGWHCVDGDRGSHDFETSKAELFDAVSHPLRIKILEALNEKPMGFAELKRAVGVESGGHLSFHITKLRHLVTTDSQGDYLLTALGKEALWTVHAPEEGHSELEVATSKASRLAVLPFANLSPDPSDEYFADGMTDEIISTVSRLDKVEVISRTSVFQYKKNPKSIGDVSRELNVGTILEGSVLKVGNRLRITTQLIDATRDRHLWAGTYDRDLKDVFAVQSEVAERIAAAMQVGMQRAGRGGTTADIDAYTMYLRAMQLYYEGTETGCREAIALFKEAISKDPTFARAYAGLARAWIMIGPAVGFVDFAVSVNRAEAAARKALELGPESAEAHEAMAEVHLALDRFEESLHELERALQINPNLAEANSYLGFHHATFGRFDESIRYARKARSLDPLAPEPVWNLTVTLRVAGRVDEALEMAERFKAVHRTIPQVHFVTVLCYLQEKDFDKALESIDIGLRFNPDNHLLRVARGMVYAMSGKREEAMHELRDLMTDEVESRRLTAQVWIGMVLGDLDEVFEALMREAETHGWWYLIKFDPLWAGLRDDSRFAEFCKKVGLPP